MNNLVLIDSCIWIDYINGIARYQAPVDSLIDNGKVCTARIIIAEIMRGARDEKIANEYRRNLEQFPCLSESKETWYKAALLSLRMRKRGYNIGLYDCYLAALVRENEVTIFTSDQHFQEIQQFKKIDLYSVRKPPP